MSKRPRGLVLAAWLLAMPLGVSAQTSDGVAHHGAFQRVTFGGEVSAVLAPPDDDAWFNYTDYEEDALRMARVRLFGEWHAADRLSVVGELRVENKLDVSASALYVRWQPSAAAPFHIQAGRIPPLVGAFARRAYGRDNAVIGLPLAYQYLTSLRAEALPLSIDDVLRMRARGWLATYPVGEYESGPGVALLSASNWDTGVEGTWQAGWIDVSAAVTRGAPAVPVVRDTNAGLMWSGRTTLRLPRGLMVGFSAARGQWIEDEVLELTPRGKDSASRQSTVAADVEMGHGPWLVRGEWLRTRFELPLVATAPDGVALSAWSGFVETRYRPHPRWQMAGRIDRLDFSTVQGTSIGVTGMSWDAPITRLEGTLGYRATRSLEVRGGWQHNWRDGGRIRARGVPAIAVLYWF
ncbi:MAG: hypothetical protein IT183_06285 [Acidobacteria bacterium]|nr:hypothetical protein [Acidobacteriota bacterium]